MLVPCLWRGSGERKRDLGPSSGRAFGPYLPTMRLHHVLGDRQPQARAAITRLRTCARLVDLVEALEDAWQIVRRDTYAAVGHADPYRITLLPSAERHPAA